MAATQSIFEIQAELCRAMSHPVRQEIVHVLRQGPMRVTDLAEATNQSQSAISRHLGVLRNAGVVSFERHSQDVLYQIANPKIVEICDLMRAVLIEDISRRSEMVQQHQDQLDNKG